MPPSAEYTVVTPLPVEQVKHVFHGHVAAQSRRVGFQSLPGSSDPFDETATFAAVASAKGLTGGWAVQIYVYDRGPVREVCLVALGSGVFATLMGGLRDALILRKSVAVAEGVLPRLPRAEHPAGGAGPGRTMR